MRSEYDIVVVGAGPSGSTAAKFAAKNGVSVLLLEKDREIGYPVRCGEAVSISGLNEFIELNNKWVATEFNRLVFISPDKTQIEVPYEERGCILERKIFDYELANMAAKEGTEILTRAYVNGLILKNGNVTGVKYLYRGNQNKVNCRLVIAADGVESRVGRWAGLKTYSDFRDMECGVQVTASNIDVDINTCYFYWGNVHAPQGYIWIFPKGNGIANVGLAVPGDVNKKRSALSFLDEFMKKNFSNAPILTQVAGGIPFTPTLKRIVGPNILLVGDAARQINPLSGGGIISGMIGGKIAGEVAGNAIIKNDLASIKDYEIKWHETLGKRHETFNRLKQSVYNLSDDKYNSIAHSLTALPKDKRTLGNIAKAAVINNPSLLVDVAKTLFKVY